MPVRQQSCSWISEEPHEDRSGEHATDDLQTIFSPTLQVEFKMSPGFENRPAQGHQTLS